MRERGNERRGEREVVEKSEWLRELSGKGRKCERLKEKKGRAFLRTSGRK